MLGVFLQGKNLDLRFRGFTVSHGKQNVHHIFQVVFQKLFVGGGIDLFRFGNGVAGNLLLLRLCDCLPLKAVYLLNEMRKQYRPGIAQGQQIVSVQDHDMAGVSE